MRPCGHETSTSFFEQSTVETVAAGTEQPLVPYDFLCHVAA